MARKFSLPAHLRSAVALLAQHHKQLRALKELINGLEPGQRTIGHIANQFAPRVGISVSDARQMMGLLMALHQLQATYSMTPDAVFDAVLQDLETDESRESWRSARSDIEDVISPSHPLYLVQKSAKLTYEHQNVLRDANIITDIRPLFDVTGRRVEQLSVTHMLVIDYYDGTDMRHIIAALDALDVEKLKIQCDRAQTKAATLQEVLKPAGFPIIVVGALDDD